MDPFSFTELVKKISHDPVTTDAVRKIGLNSDAANVLDMLCREAVETDDPHVRAVLIQTLREKSGEAAVRFSDLGIHDENPKTRKRAFVCLRLMESRNAEEAVIQGLADRDPSVRIAAAYNAGLYEDTDFIKAFESFMERNRWSIAMEMMREAVRSFALVYHKMENHLMKYLLYGGLNSGTKKA